MENKSCIYYDSENGWCKKLSDWSEAMPHIVHCPQSPCEHETVLKPCPFCGSESLKIESKHNGQWYYTGTHSATVRCNKCHARGGTASCKASINVRGANEEAIRKAIEKWNERA